MRKYTLLALSLLVTSCLFAQFKLTKNGFVDANDDSKNYVVLSYDNNDQSELYKKTLLFLTSFYKSPKDVISEVPDDMITINGFQEDAVKIGKGLMSTVYDMGYTITLRFREGRIRIDSPSFDCTTYVDGKKCILTFSESNAGFGTVAKTGIFKKNGNVNQKGAKESLENFFNFFIEKLNASITGETDNETDW